MAAPAFEYSACEAAFEDRATASSIIARLHPDDLFALRACSRSLRKMIGPTRTHVASACSSKEKMLWAIETGLLKRVIVVSSSGQDKWMLHWRSAGVDVCIIIMFTNEHFDHDVLKMGCAQMTYPISEKRARLMYWVEAFNTMNCTQCSSAQVCAPAPMRSVECSLACKQKITYELYKNSKND
jgi:hypothetical protein